MRNTRSPKWARRHRQQHAAFLRGATLPLDARTSKRFSGEFENALKQRGAEAKKAMEDAHG